MKLVLITSIFFCCLTLSVQRPNEPVYDLEMRNEPTNALIQFVESSPFVQQIKDNLINQKEIADLFFPIMVRAITSPVPGLADALQRSMALFGVTSYLVGPTLSLAARELAPGGVVQRINQASELQPLFDTMLTILGINNDLCKETIACQAGVQVARDYPTLARYLSQTTTSTRSADDKFANILVNVMSSGNLQCPSDCPNLELIAKYWKESGEKDFMTLAKDAIANNL